MYDLIRGMIKPILISLSYQILSFIFVKAYSVSVGTTCTGFLNFNICIFVGHSMMKTGRVIITLTRICHIYLPAPATFIYQHLPHLSTSTCHIYLPAPATFIYHHLPHLSTSICHIYLPPPAMFIYRHLPCLSTTTCHIYLPPPAFLMSNVVVFLSSVIWRKMFFIFIFIFILVKLLTISV